MIKAILFDLGDTLMCPAAAWPPVIERADRAVVDVLCKNGLGLDCDHFHEELKERLHRYYAERDNQQIETSTMSVLQELLDEKGYRSVPSALVRAALDARYRISQSNWQLADDALSTLTALRAGGCRLAIVSNAGDNKDVFQLVEKFKIEPYFDFVLTSAACGWRKPHPRIFELALAHWGFLPGNAVMVGDKLEADIAGANQAGIFSIWARRYAQIPEEVVIKPDAQVESLTEILKIIKNLP
ncbi:MAG: HAD-IA family hydrolase [Anaerolineales bacterium]|jgi:HAD superfamily hydrolase (TIGR01549 family)|nr:HAD-IA family hydrolase [Anaerolineales bacterium]